PAWRHLVQLGTARHPTKGEGRKESAQASNRDGAQRSAAGNRHLFLSRIYSAPFPGRSKVTGFLPPSLSPDLHPPYILAPSLSLPPRVASTPVTELRLVDARRLPWRCRPPLRSRRGGGTSVAPRQPKGWCFFLLARLLQCWSGRRIGMGRFGLCGGVKLRALASACCCCPDGAMHAMRHRVSSILH
uniref:Uncharacterized protein n=1 Tax=Aegilops tauschii subsp. strangulata TaxID=200361 RepID=A0A453ALD9_AEGTS